MEYQQQKKHSSLWQIAVTKEEWKKSYTWWFRVRMRVLTLFSPLVQINFVQYMGKVGSEPVMDQSPETKADEEEAA